MLKRFLLSGGINYLIFYNEVCKFLMKRVRLLNHWRLWFCLVIQRKVLVSIVEINLLLQTQLFLIHGKKSSRIVLINDVLVICLEQLHFFSVKDSFAKGVINHILSNSLSSDHQWSRLGLLLNETGWNNWIIITLRVY